MRFLIEMGLEDLRELPERFRQQIASALNLTQQVPQQPPVMQQAPPVQSFTMAPPAMQQAPPVQSFQQMPPVVTQKQPVIVGDKRVFPADRSHPTQQNSAVDVMTGQTVPVYVPQAAPVPQMGSNAPVNVAPVGAPIPTTVAPPMQVDVATVKGALVRTANNPNIAGKEIVGIVLKEAGVLNVAGITNENASRVMSALIARGVA